MQTLGVSQQTPGSDSRLKNLFWPSVHSSSDVDSLGTQGYWVCAAIAVVSFLWLTFLGQPIVGALVLLVYYLSGVGVRERSRYAAGFVFIAYAADMVVSGPSIIKVLAAALLLSNFRSTWIASLWKQDSAEAVEIPRWGETWGDKFADKFPRWLWPKIRIFYYVLSVCYFCLLALGIVAVIRHR
jgi:uncharacterized protein involved in cysteine biosynthesis